jgi:hypothetical protein
MATTANPRPLSPARDASMAAFSESMLVWNATSSITRTTLDTRSTACCSCSMDCTVSRMDRWPCSAWTVRR